LLCSVLNGDSLLLAAMKDPHHLNGQTHVPVSSPHKLDYVNALVLNSMGEALVFEVQKPNSGVYWQLLDRYLQPKEDPFTAAQQKLKQMTGFQTSQWAYLGSHAIEASRLFGMGFLFCAQQAVQVAEPEPNRPEVLAIKWVPLVDLRYALLDGRISIMSHALTVSLSLLTILK
jgi:hypothetical protein